MKFKLTLEYDGTRFSGWQVQKNARTIQGVLIEAARDLCGTDVDIQGAGRTDAGVHALAQMAHLETAKRLEARAVLFGLNDRLPATVNILKVERAEPKFHARHDAVGRSYIYIISKQRTAFAKRFVWWVRDGLDTARMADAAGAFRGFRDFSSFADKRIDKNASTLVEVTALDMLEADGLIILRIAGSHFLWRMVRRMVGILIEAGRGNLARADVERLMRERSEVPARFTAPPSGLFLEQVLYKGDTFRRSLPQCPLLVNTLKVKS